MNLYQLRQFILMPPQALGTLPRYGALRPRFYRHSVEQVDSSNRAGAAAVPAGAPAGTVLVADTQWARRGQQWQSPPGGLYLSLGLTGFNSVPPTDIALQQLIHPETTPAPLKTLEGLAAIALYCPMQGYLLSAKPGRQGLPCCLPPPRSPPRPGGHRRRSTQRGNRRGPVGQPAGANHKPSI